MLYPTLAGRSPRAAVPLAALLLLLPLAAAPPAAASHVPTHPLDSLPRPFPGSQVGDAVLFSARAPVDGDTRSCIWRTDGTPAGTFPLPGCLFSFQVARVGSVVVIPDSENGATNLWATDGSETGTVPLASIPSLVSFDQSHAVSPSDELFAFEAFDPATGLEPWVTDGTPEGTHLLADAVPGTAGANPTGFAFLDDGRLVFAGASSVTGGPTAIWRSDLTAAGTLPSTVLGRPILTLGRPLFTAAGAVVFWLPVADDRYALWRTDGTAPGTRKLGDFSLPGDDVVALRPTRLGDHLYFEADDGVHGPEVWRTDGDGLERMTDVDAEGPLATAPVQVVPFGDGGVAVVLEGPEGRAGHGGRSPGARVRQPAGRDLRRGGHRGLLSA